MAAVRGQSYVVEFTAWDVTINPPTPKTGVASNITVYITKDGGNPAPTTNSPAEVNASNTPGLYRVILTASEMDADSIGVYPMCSVSGVLCERTLLLTDRGRFAHILNTLTTIAENTTNIAQQVWQYTNRSLSDVANIISGVWSAANRIITGLTTTAIDTIWHRDRAASNPPSGSYGHNLDAQVSSRHPNANVTVGGYASGQSPAEQVLATPANKLATNTSGHVTVGGYASGQTPANYILANTNNKLLTNTSGHVTVGGYATGQSPNELVLVTPANKLVTDTSGRVTVGTNADKTGYTLTAAEHTNIAGVVWAYTTRTLSSFGNLVTDIWNHSHRTLTSFGTLVSDIASAVWSFSTRVITGLTDAAVDLIWNRLRSATSRPVGSFGYYVDAQISGISGGGGGSGFVGPRTLTFRVRDGANQPVVGALVVVQSVGAALTNADGELVVAMPEGTFTVSVVARDGLLFDSQQTPATGDGTLTFTGYTRVPPQAQEPGTCVVYVDVTASCAGTLTIVELPRKLSGGKWLVGQTQQQSAINGRITFDAVPFGATVRVVVPAAKIDTTFVVPEASSYAV